MSDNEVESLRIRLDKIYDGLFVGFNGQPSIMLKLQKTDNKVHALEVEMDNRFLQICKDNTSALAKIEKIITDRVINAVDNETPEEENVKVALRVAKHFKQYWLRWVAGGTIAGLSFDKFQALFEILTK